MTKQLLTERYRINNQNLALRKQFVLLTEAEIAVLKRLAGWGQAQAGPMAKEFYDHQFAFSGTAGFFEAYARQKGMAIESMRQHLEKMQAQYFRQIFEEATGSGEFGVDFFEKRLFVGKLHNVINLPLKWYIGSYALYQRLVRKHLRRSFWLRPGFRTKAEEAIFTVFNYDIQAVSDAFFYDYLESVGLELAAVQIE
ncbi:MAG: hypothetical protein KDF65_12420, partial [Anaerolineae bacterium]|nr:hypothetical protein [Anaerolineae bacterium]